MVNYITLDIIIPFFERLDFLEILLKRINNNYVFYKEQINLKLIIVNDSPWKFDELESLVSKISWNFEFLLLNQKSNH